MTDKQITLAIGAITHAELVIDFPDVVLDALNSVVAFLATMDEQPERKKGKWIWQTENRYICSECGYHTQVDELFEEPMYAFCPYCSTSMLDKDGNVRYER